MKPDPIASGKRKTVNLSLDTGVVEAARAAGLNLSQICEAALREASRTERAAMAGRKSRLGGIGQPLGRGERPAA